ncbi:hypothetical protein FZI51_19105 [Cronobacter sakazakii]|nr:hypothetical protein FZI46_01020 [Cronobacter sakazakii]KAB1482085.1 hypothetical protein FZI51_19105 [Cronobacter sakazakii]KAB1492576.1 hypothetical protein FZH95_22070 [Cronobacter sakazakii]HAU5453320.1 hypothetical protein [Cronobacter sakazakii]
MSSGDEILTPVTSGSCANEQKEKQATIIKTVAKSEITFLIFCLLHALFTSHTNTVITAIYCTFLTP